MKMLKLLGATSVAALLAGAASAQLALEQSAGGAPTVSAPYAIAEEVDFPALQLAGDADAVFGLEVLTQGVIPPGQNIFLTVNITNGTLTANLDGSEILGGITGAVVDTGGAIGDSSVRYLITTDTADLSTGDATRDGILLNLPVEVSSCGDVTFDVSEFETESGGTDIEGGSAALTVAGVATPAVTCEDAFQANLVVDADSTTLDFAAAFAEFVVAAPDTLTTGVLGDYDLTVDTTVNIDMNSTAATPGDVLGFASSIDFADTTNIVDGTATVAVGTLFADDGAPTLVSGSSIPLVGTTAATAATESGIFTVSIAGPGFPVSPQTVSVSGAVLSLDTGDNLLATDAFLTADVEDLKLNGQYFGPFDWVSDSTKAVNTIFRITGLDGLSDIPAQIIVQNSRNGLNGVFPFTILASDVQGSEIRLNSAALEGVAGLFGTADISIVFSTALDLDVDRLLAGPSTATVVPFGDGANDSGTGSSYPTTPPTSDNDDAGNY